MYKLLVLGKLLFVPNSLPVPVVYHPCHRDIGTYEVRKVWSKHPVVMRYVNEKK
jgi:predicted lipase